MLKVKEEESSHLTRGVDYSQTRTTLFINDYYEVVEEILNGVNFYHIEFDEFTPTAYKMMLKDWELVKEHAKKNGWDAVHAYSQNNPFLKKLGFEKVAEVDCLSGEAYGVYRCLLT